MRYFNKEMTKLLLNKMVVHLFETNSTVIDLGNEKPPLTVIGFAIYLENGPVITIENKYTLQNFEHPNQLFYTTLIKINQKKDKYIEFVFKRYDEYMTLCVDMSKNGYVGPEAIIIHYEKNKILVIRDEYSKLMRFYLWLKKRLISKKR